ncbi:MAG: DUF2017 family protein [Actinomycetota bacterium]
MPALEERADGSALLRLDETESDMLRRLVEEMKALLEVGMSGDPVLERLFPDAYEDPTEAQSYRDLTGDDLMSAKVEALEAVRATLGERGGAVLALDAANVDAWLPILTDLRLAIGTRLDVDDQGMQRAPAPGDPSAAALSVLHWLGRVQQTIVEVRLTRALDEA